MALPSTRRPAIIEEELLEESSKPKRKKINLHQTFMDIMIRWYEIMGKRRRRKLTASKLKRRALEAVESMSYDYDRLPLDWVAQLADETGMKLYERKRKVKDFSFLEERGTIQVVIDPLSLPPNTKTLLSNVAFRSGSSQPSSSATSTKENGSDWAKPVIDLTREPPPADWIEAYAKGEHRRRELTVVHGKDNTIMFYDYNPRYEGPEGSGIDQDGKIASQPVHDASSFNWFKDEVPPLDLKDCYVYT